MRLLTDLFASLLQNAFILYKSYLDKPTKYDSRMFIEALLSEIAEMASAIGDSDSDSDSGTDAGPARNAHRRDWWTQGPGAALRLKGRTHWPLHATDTWAKNHPTTGDKMDYRRYCMYSQDCGRVLTYCVKCKVPLCLAHFEAFHTQRADEFPCK